MFYKIYFLAVCQFLTLRLFDSDNSVNLPQAAREDKLQDLDSLTLILSCQHFFFIKPQ
jgi:hypothetical protein